MNVAGACGGASVPQSVYIPAMAFAALLSASSLAGCADRGSGGDGGGPRTIHVPKETRTITAALESADAGDLILVQPGVYRETVEVDRPRVTIRGVDRNSVIIDGELVRPNGVILRGPESAVQNLTVRNATLSGVLVTGRSGSIGGEYGESDPARTPALQGFLVDHVTSHNNGLYGIYAFNAQEGAIQNSYTSGMAEAGIYVGRCKPCSIVVRHNVAERNAVGFEATNASGPLYVYGNRFVGNRVGATTNSQRQEAFVPQEGAHVMGNVIAANNQELAPSQAEGGFGIGLGIGGGTMNTVAKNLIVGNGVAGVVIASAGDLAPIGNKVLANMFGANGIDVAYTATAAAPGRGNCVEESALTRILPGTFPMGCPGPDSESVGMPLPVSPPPAGIPFADVEKPPPLPNFPDATTEGPPAMPGIPGAVDETTFTVPGHSLLQDHSTIRW